MNQELYSFEKGAFPALFVPVINVIGANSRNSSSGKF
jgi:hypothetical protein